MNITSKFQTVCASFKIAWVDAIRLLFGAKWRSSALLSDLAFNDHRDGHRRLRSYELMARQKHKHKENIRRAGGTAVLMTQRAGPCGRR